MRLLSFFTKLFFIFSIIGAFFYYLLFTDTGLNHTFYWIKKIVPGELQAKELHGSLAKQMTFHQLLYHNHTVNVSIDFLQIHWAPTDLWRKKIHIKNIIASGAIIQWEKGQEPKRQAGPAPDFSYVRYFQLDHAHIKNLRYFPQPDLYINQLMLGHQGPHTIIHSEGSLNHFPIQGHVELSQQAGKIIIHNSYLKSLGADAELEGSIDQNKKINLKWQLKVLELGRFYEGASGSLQSMGKIIGPFSAPFMEGYLKAGLLKIEDFQTKQFYAHIHTEETPARPIAIAVRAEALQYHDITLPHLYAKTLLTFLTGSIQVGSKIVAGAHNAVFIKSTLPPLDKITDPSQPIVVHAKWSMKNLNGFLSVPAIKKVTGEWLGQAQITGCFSKPIVFLTTRLFIEHLAVPEIKTKIDNIILHARYETRQPAELAGTFEVGKGKANLEGKINWEQEGLSLSLHLTGKKLHIQYDNEYDVLFSPTLSISYSNNLLDTTGNVIVHSAYLTPYDTSQVVTLPKETIFLNTAGPQKNMPPGLSFHVHVDFEKVKLAYHKLNVALKGALDIIAPQDKWPTGVGRLSIVQGSYPLFGRTLHIMQGELLYAGNLLTVPHLHIQVGQTFDRIELASDKSQWGENKLSSLYSGTGKLTVGAWIDGTIDQPKISFFSDPPGLGQSDILSYLAFGVPRSQITARDSLALLNHMVTSNQDSKFNLEDMTKKIEKQLKLSELSISSTEIYDPTTNTTVQTPTVHIAKNLGNKLSIHYKTGLFFPVSILSLQYKINRYFLLQSEASTIETGADFLYSIELE